MLSYQHSYHAGCFADVMKHAILARILQYLTQKDKPLFLAIHFCLPHYPYVWASYAENHDVLAEYGASIAQVDRQIRAFFVLLQKNHFLDHAIVVFLSDHGEALELHGDRITEKFLFQKRSHASYQAVPQFYPPSWDHEAINQSVGHGTDVLSLTQYHSLLAFRLYGMMPQQKGLVPGITSLLDIKPTLLALIGLSAPKTQGYSLANILTGKTHCLPDTAKRHVFLESDFTPQSIRTIFPQTQKIIMEGIHLFRIDPISTRLMMKDSMGKMVIKSKQYADIYQHWILALYPQNLNEDMPILVNLETGEWTNDLHSQLAIHSPVFLMLKQLKLFYGDEITHII